MTWNRSRRWLIPIVALAAVGFVARTAWWIAEGCPVWFSLGSCGSDITGGRSIVAFSDNLLDEVKLTASKDRAVIRLGRREVVVRDDLVSIDRSTNYTIPAACKRLEVAASGRSIRVVADDLALIPDAPGR